MRIIPVFAAMTFAATAALAQSPAPAPSTVPSVSPPAATMAPKTIAPTMTDEQAKTWIDKKVVSSDNKNLGEVAGFQRDSTGKVVELHADIGGFLGLGETRVRVPADKFKLESDRVVLSMNSEQVKALPHIKK